MGQWFAMEKCCLWFWEAPQLQSSESGYGHVNTESVPPKVSVKFLRWNRGTTLCVSRNGQSVELPITHSSAETRENITATADRIWWRTCHTHPSLDVQPLQALCTVCSWKNPILLWQNVLLRVYNQILKDRFLSKTIEPLLLSLTEKIV